MGRTDAGAVPAEVIEFEAFSDRSVEQLEENPMRPVDPATTMQLAIANRVSASGPFPTVIANEEFVRNLGQQIHTHAVGFSPSPAINRSISLIDRKRRFTTGASSGCAVTTLSRYPSQLTFKALRWAVAT